MKSKILSLAPFIDQEGIIRVGGRLQNATIHRNMKNPIQLHKSNLSLMIIQDTHNQTLHGGITQMKTLIREEYWIIGLTNAVKKCYRNCVKCTRYSNKSSYQFMGNLPDVRVQQAHPFMNTGVDYAGPFNIKCSKERGIKTFKGFIAVFICLATKAIHLEAV